MKESNNSEQYIATNRWLIILLASVSLVVMQEILESTAELQTKLPEIVVYPIAGIGLAFAGFLSMLAGTVTAKLFRGMVVVAVSLSIIFRFLDLF